MTFSEGTIADLQKLLLGKDSSISGDYNRDGTVNASDYVMWRNTMGQKVPLYTAADGNGNAVIDAGDFTMWKSHFGQTAGSGASPSGATGSAGAAVPEPATIVLAAILVAFFAAPSRFFFNRRE